ILADLSGRRTMTEHLDGFKADGGDPRIERSLPKFLNRFRASDGDAAGGHHLSFRRIQCREGRSVALGRCRREPGVRGLDSRFSTLGVCRRGQTRKREKHDRAKQTREFHAIVPYLFSTLRRAWAESMGPPPF